MLGCFNPNLGKIWNNPNVGLKNVISLFTFYLIAFLTQHLGLSIFAQIWVETTQHFSECVEVSSAHQSCNYLIKNTVKSVIL